MNVSSRTPEGRFNHCPICGEKIRIEPSEPSGDAPCPHCGVLLWFVETEYGLAFYDWADIRRKHRVMAPASGDTGRLASSTCEVTVIESGSRVRICEGTFESFEGTVEQIEPFAGKVRVIITIFGRETPVELMIWQVESI